MKVQNIHTQLLLIVKISATNHYLAENVNTAQAKSSPTAKFRP
jgi:hypothetical protein